METWNEARVEQLRALKAEGIAHKEIARRMHLRPGQVAGKLHRLAGYQRPPKPRRPASESKVDERHLLAAAIVNDGGTFEEAMEESGLTWEETRRAIINAGARERAERRRKEADHAR